MNLRYESHFDLPIGDKVPGYVYRITEHGVNIVTKHLM